MDLEGGGLGGIRRPPDGGRIVLGALETLQTPNLEYFCGKHDEDGIQQVREVWEVQGIRYGITNSFTICRILKTQHCW